MNPKLASIKSPKEPLIVLAADAYWSLHIFLELEEQEGPGDDTTRAGLLALAKLHCLSESLDRALSRVYASMKENAQ